MTAGQEFVKRLKPIGCVIFIVMFALFLVICFTAAGNAPVKGYIPPHDTEYFSSHLDELKAELEEKLLTLPGVREVVVSGEGESREVQAEIYPSMSEEFVRNAVNQLNLTLPVYKRIKTVVFRKEPFPRTSSGKIKV